MRLTEISKKAHLSPTLATLLETPTFLSDGSERNVRNVCGLVPLLLGGLGEISNSDYSNVK